MKISFSELLHRYLLSVGINTIYGVVGREAASLSFNTSEEFRFVLTRHEMTAGLMAAAITRFSKKPQVCFGTLGPGLTNFMTALATATLDRHPVIFIVAQLETPYILHNDAHQCVDNVSIARPLSKYAYEMNNSGELRLVLENAFKASMSFPFGPSVISVPINILDENVEADDFSDLVLDRDIILPVVHEEMVEKKVHDVSKIIKSSKRPIAIVGDAAVKVEGGKESVKKFAEQTNIPVITTYSAKGIMANESHLNYGVLSSYVDSVLELKINTEIFEEADLILFIGYDLCERHPFLWSNKSVPKTLVNINCYNNGAHIALKPKISIISDLNDSIAALLSDLGDYKNTELVDIASMNQQIRRLLEDKNEYKEGITHPQVIHALDEIFGNNYILANDIGMHRHLSSIFFRATNPEDYITSEGLSSFGTGLGLGMGAKIANPDRYVVVIAGDGGFHSNDGDLETAVRLKLKILVIVLNSDSNALIERYQLKGKYHVVNKRNTSFGKVDFALLAKANGCKSGTARSLKELHELIEKSKTYDGPFVIEVPVFYPRHYINEYSGL